MPSHYDVILCGTGIFFENLADQPIIGFLTARRVRAVDETEAARRARHLVLVHWNHSHNADRKLGVPVLNTLVATPASRWVHRHPTEDYFFFDNEPGKHRHLQTIRDSARPWYRLASSGRY